MLHRIEYAFAVRRLFDRIRKTHAIDVIHQLNPVVLGISGLLYGRGVPLVLGPYWPSWSAAGPDVGTTFIRRARTYLKDMMKRITFARCNAILTPTDVSKREVLDAGAKKDTVIHLNIGIDPDEFAPAEGPAAAEHPTVLFLANPMRRKGIFVLLEAFEMLNARIPDARLVIGGAGHELNAVQEAVSRMACSHRVTVLGHIARERVAEILRSCSVYCLPSFGEPYGMSALEAMSCGRPLVVTNKGGLNDLVREQGGLKVEPRDAAALAEALERVLVNPQLQRQMGDFNRRLVLDDYAWDSVLDRLESVYFSAVEQRPDFAPQAAGMREMA